MLYPGDLYQVFGQRVKPSVWPSGGAATPMQTYYTGIDAAKNQAKRGNQHPPLRKPPAPFPLTSLAAKL